MAPFSEVARRDLLHTYMKFGFEDEEDLDFYIQTYLGITIPKHQFCVGHTSPFRFICDIYFDRVKFALAFGSRGSGKTFDFALINHLKALFKQYPLKLLMSASTLDQTNNGYAYFKQFLEHDPALWEQLNGEPIQSRTRFKNGSTLQIAAGTMKGLNGPHPNITTIDEVELMELPVLEQGLSMSISSGDIPAQDILGSTRKRTAGTMNTLLAEKEDRNLAVYTFCVWEALEQCTRQCQNDPDWGTCLAWNKCKGKAHDCRGWYPISAFIQKTSNLSTAMFSTEWENKSPSGGFPVYAEHFDENVHVLSMVGGGKFKTFASIFQEKDIPKHWRRIAGMDFGAHFAYLQIALEPKYDIWVVFFEYYHHGDRLLSRHAQEIKRQPYWRSRLPIFSDPSGHQSILEMRGYGLNCLPAMNDLAEGVDEVKARLEINPVNGLPRLFVLDTCTALRKEFTLWEHGALPDGKPDLDTYEDGNDHCFVAGTLIDTDRGQVPIEQVKHTDYVLTRQGYKPLLLQWETSEQPVITVHLSNGKCLTGTPNHPVWVEGKGWAKLDSLRYDDILVQAYPYKEAAPWHDLSLLSTEVSSSGVIPILPTWQTAAITVHMPTTSATGLVHCIATSGNAATVPSLLAGMCTTKTAMSTTINSPISNVYRKLNTIESIGRKSLQNVLHSFRTTQHRSAHLPKSGTSLQRDGHGTGSTRKFFGRMLSQLYAVVYSVGELTKLGIGQKPCFALISASQRPDVPAELIILKKHAENADRSLPAINTSSRIFAHASACRVERVETARHKATVYNLTVADAHEYFANGILVSNCLDSLRYPVFTYPRRPKTHVKATTIAGL